MITFAKLHSYGHRLGNQLFELASLQGLALQYGHDVKIPLWEYTNFFKKQFNQTDSFIPVDVHLSEESFHYDEKHWEIIGQGKNLRYDILGYLQSEKYWEKNKEEVLKYFDFIDDFTTVVKPKFKKVYEKKTIAISCRRGDYVGNPNYQLLPISYYIHALFEHFSDWREYNILIFSDDIEWCRVHFQCLDNAYFTTGQSAIEQLYLMSQCSDFIIANSTFSWWGAYLAEHKRNQNGKHTKIICPKYYFDGNLGELNNTKDFWPEKWIKFDHTGKKFDLKDVTFTIPIGYDSPDREQNLMLSLCMLQRDFDTNIIIGEQGKEAYFREKVNCKYHYFEVMETFHRTKMLNEMAIMAETPIIVNYDADVILPPLALIEAANIIRRGEGDILYPYNGKFARVPRDPWFFRIEGSLDVGIFRNEVFVGARDNSLHSVGGCIMYSKDSFIFGGMENEYMIHYGPEDQERYERFGRLGYKVKRVNSLLFHMDHKIVDGTTADTPWYDQNCVEFNKERQMSIEELGDYIGTWPWVHTYSAAYYEVISPGAIVSAREVFRALKGILEPIENDIVDFGGGIGQWGVAAKEFGYTYLNCDFRIPIQKLLVDSKQYMEHDLRNTEDFPLWRFSLAICTEVMEHIEEKYAQKIIKFLTKHADKILFSAAIPYQGGQNHLNEQWQTYWAKLFEENGYYPINIRPLIQDNKNIEIWYRNNLCLFSKEKSQYVVTDMVLPELYTNIIGTLTKWEGNKKPLVSQGPFS